MHVIVVLDAHGGMSFNHRRQSRDKALYERIFQLIGEHRLWMNSQSAKVFSAWMHRIFIAEDYADQAEADDYCFVEDNLDDRYKRNLQSIVVYRWHRDYPSDVVFNMDLSTWRLVSSKDFAGNSHEKITEEVYMR